MQAEPALVSLSKIPSDLRTASIEPNQVSHMSAFKVELLI